MTGGDWATIALLVVVIGSIWLGRRKGRQALAKALAAARAEGYAAARSDAAASATAGVVNVISGGGSDLEALRAALAAIQAGDTPGLDRGRTLRLADGRDDDNRPVGVVQDATRPDAIPTRDNGPAVAHGGVRSRLLRLLPGETS